MKYLFCDNINNSHSDDSREHWAESEFLSVEAPAARADDVERAEKELKKIESRGKWKEYIPTFSKVTLFIGIILALAVVYEIYVGNTTIAESYKYSPIAFCGAICALALAGGSFLLGRTAGGRPVDENKVRAALKDIDAAEQKLVKSLNVPKNADKVDILKFAYEEKDGRAEVLFMAEYCEMDLFDRDGSLCIFDGSDIFALPKKELTGIKIHDKELLTENWNKSEPQDSDRFRRYGVKPRMGLKYYCSLDVEREGEKYSLLFPAYELDTISRLTELEAPKLPGNSGKKKGKR